MLLIAKNMTGIWKHNGVMPVLSRLYNLKFRRL